MSLFAEEAQLNRLSKLGDSLEKLRIIDFEAFRPLLEKAFQKERKSSSTSLRDTFSDSIKSINGVVWVLIVAAGLLSVVVLYSLTYVNICERRKELSTIAVLGFHEREVESYIFRETNVLSFVGSLLGLLIGVRLHSYVVRTVEVEQVMFGRNVYLPSYLYALLISAVFTLLVNELLRKKIRSIDMVEAMKAND